MTTPLKKFGLDKLQTSMGKALPTQQGDISFDEAQLVRNVSLAAGTASSVGHSLGRVPDFVFVGNQSDFARVRINSLTARAASVESDATITCSVIFV